MIETVFQWPGLGSLTLNAANHKDYPLILAMTMAVTILVVISSFFADLAYCDRRSPDSHRMSSAVLATFGIASRTRSTKSKPRAGFWKRFRRHRVAFISLVFLAFMGLAALLTPYISPYDPYAMNLVEANQRPSLEHPLGTDKLGRDTLTRVFVGGRVSIAVALAAVAISSSLGTVLGLTGRIPRRLGRYGDHADHRYLHGVSVVRAADRARINAGAERAQRGADPRVL